MRIGVPQETARDERRVALVPDGAGRLSKAGLEILVQRGAGAKAGFADSAYEKAGASLCDAPAALGAQVVVKVQRPTPEEARLLASGGLLVCLLQPARRDGLLDLLAQRKLTALAMERVPRITRAQAMDALSSQATVAGYKAVLLGAAALPKLLPMLTTAAGTLAPARAFVIGAGVAGLQAIATARRLGAVVSAIDVRPAVKEQVQSLGATFVDVEAVSAEGAGGYARELDTDQQARLLAAIARHLREVDLVVTTAQIPERPAPRLITAEMVRAMRPGSVIVDLAAESGGNCELTRPGETVEADGVTLIGPVNLASTLPQHASQMYSRNVQSLLEHLFRGGVERPDLGDEIARAMAVIDAGELRVAKEP
jgi:NAD(P) transhydrogenase subunit alpha